MVRGKSLACANLWKRFPPVGRSSVKYPAAACFFYFWACHLLSVIRCVYPLSYGRPGRACQQAARLATKQKEETVVTLLIVTIWMLVAGFIGYWIGYASRADEVRQLRYTNRKLYKWSNNLAKANQELDLELEVERILRNA